MDDLEGNTCMAFANKVRYCRVFWRCWYQPLRRGWRLWVYRMRFDGLMMWAIHIGPLIIGTDWEEVDGPEQ